MRHFLLTPLALAFLLLGATQTRGDDSLGDEAIKEAITILEARKAQAEKKEDQKKIGDAIASLEKLLAKAGDPKKVDPAKVDDELGLTPAVLSKKLAGRAVFNKKTDELTLVYDLKDKADLKDFDLGDAKPTIAKGVLPLKGGESIQHIVKFKTLTLTGQISSHFNGKDHIGTTSGVTISGSGTLVIKGGGYAETGFWSDKGLFPFKLEVLPTRVGFTSGTKQGGVPVKDFSCGQVTLSGGSSGNQFTKLIFTGKLDDEWAKEFFSK